MVAYVDTHSEWNVYLGSPIVEIVVEVGTAAIVDRWNHFAVTREGSTVRLFVNGVLLGSGTSNTNLQPNGIGIGYADSSGYGWAGYIQDFRVYKGVAKYTDNFVVPSRSPDILPDTPSGVSGSSKLTKIVDGAVSFDGTGDFLSIADNADFEFDGDFTIECFVYLTDNSSVQTFISKRATNNDYGPFSLYTNANATILQFLASTDGSSWNLDLNGSTSLPISKNKWTHVCLLYTSPSPRDLSTSRMPSSA